MRYIALVLLACFGLSAQQSGIEGIAVDAVTRQPMAGVHITMGSASAVGFMGGGDADVYGAISRQDGRFSVTGLKPGIYFVEARHNGYLHLPPRDSTGSEDPTVTLKPGEPLKDYVVEMTPHAVIVGHVLDENGDPVEHVEVAAEAAAPGAARQSIGMAGGGRTDDRGAFRIVLPPGKFYVQARMNRGMGFAGGMMGGPEIRSDGLAPPVYGPTFYPSAASKDKAIAVELAPGQNATGIDIHLAQQRSLTIGGTVTGMPAGSPPGIPAFISITSLGENGTGSQSAFTGPDGKFTAAGLSAGKYQLRARYSVDGAELRSPAVEVQLGNANETGVTLPLVAGGTVSGTLEIEGKSKSTPAEKLAVRLESDSGGSVAAEVGEDGTFRVEKVFPDRLRLRVMPLPENAYVKSVKVGGAEATDGFVDLSHGVNGAAIAIAISRNGGRLEGKVVEDGNPSTSPLALVFLADSGFAASGEDPDERSMKPVEAGEKFTYSGLRPGKYRLMVLDPRQLMGGRDNAEVLKALLAGAPEIEIHEGDRITKDAKITTVENPGAK